MANITNGTFCPRSETVSVQLCARAFKEFLATDHSYSILDESRNHTDFALYVFTIKDIAFFFGISKVLSGTVTLLSLMTLLNCIFIFMARNSILNFTVIWTFFASFLCYKSRIIQLPTIARFVFSVTALCLAPIHFRVPCTLDYILDVLFVARVGNNILGTFFGPIDEIIRDIFLVATVIVLFLAFGPDFDGKGTYFMLTGMFFLLSPLTFHAFKHRKLFLFLLVAFIQNYCVYEQFFIYRTLSANITYHEQSANITYEQSANITYEQSANITYEQSANITYEQSANITYNEQSANVTGSLE